MEIEKSEYVKEVFENLKESTKVSYRTTLNRFVNEFVKTKTIAELVEEAKSDVKATQQRIDLFYKWLQTEFKSERTGKPLTENSAFIIAYGFLRGFFANLDVYFERKWKKRIPKHKRMKEALKNDKVYTFFDVDEKTRTIHFNREFMQQFLANLKLRDQTIILALLSSSQDSGDLFKLNIGDVKNQKNGRIFWEGNRQKTGVLFRAFLSKQATRFIRKYIEQERKDARDNEPLFISTGFIREKQKDGTIKTSTVEKRMVQGSLSANCREAARKMGIKWENGEMSPLRPRRMRHLFRTACDIAGIDEIYKNAFMGHKNSQGQDYSELSRAVLELAYLRVEPFVSVFGDSESSEIKEDVAKLESRIVDLNREIADQKGSINTLKEKIDYVEHQREFWMKRFEEKAQSYIDKQMNELKKEILESDKQQQEWQQGMSKTKIFSVKGKQLHLSKLDLLEILNLTSEEEADKIWLEGLTQKMEEKLIKAIKDKKEKIAYARKIQKKLRAKGNL